MSILIRLHGASSKALGRATTGQDGTFRQDFTVPSSIPASRPTRSTSDSPDAYYNAALSENRQACGARGTPHRPLAASAGSRCTDGSLKLFTASLLLFAACGDDPVSVSDQVDLKITISSGDVAGGIMAADKNVNTESNPYGVFVPGRARRDRR
jgi:hypothetical protein